MKKINDSKLYFNTSIVMLVIGLVFGIVSYYSILFVEPEIKELIKKGSEIEILLSDSETVKEEKINKINKYFKRAYLKLRNPQIFARYENFDQKSMRIKNWITLFDRLVYENGSFTPNDSHYLSVFLKRREQGSGLGRVTMFFFFCLAFAAFIFYLTERKYKSTK